jgi:hypothetical protein
MSEPVSKEDLDKLREELTDKKDPSTYPAFLYRIRYQLFFISIILLSVLFLGVKTPLGDFSIENPIIFGKNENNENYAKVQLSSKFANGKSYIKKFLSTGSNSDIVFCQLRSSSNTPSLIKQIYCLPKEYGGHLGIDIRVEFERSIHPSGHFKFSLLIYQEGVKHFGKPVNIES